MTDTLTRQTWGGIPVLVIEWDYQGKHRRVPLDMRTGKHYVSPRTDGLTDAILVAVRSLFGEKVTRKEARTLYQDNQQMIDRMVGGGD